MTGTGNAMRVRPWLALMGVLAGGPVWALQILEAADHAELSAVVSSQAVNRIALEGDRIARVVQSSGAFTVEHDPVRGDLYLYPAPGGAAAPGGADASGGMQGPYGGQASGHAFDPSVTLYLGTERGFTYRLSLTAVARESAQVLIRNGVLAGNGSERGAAGQGRETELAELIRAVAQRRPLAGYAIVPAPNAGDPNANIANPEGDVSPVEVWRGARFTARVFWVRAGAEVGAADLAEARAPGVAAAWLAPAARPAEGSPGDGGPAYGGPGQDGEARRFAIVVERSVVSENGP